jgi:hypothetical protein
MCYRYTFKPVLSHTKQMRKKFLLLNWILVISYGGIISFAFYSSAYSWPTQGSVIWFLLLIFCPPFLYHCVFISYVLVLDKKPHWKKIYRLITLVGGVLFAGGLLQITQKISLSRFKTAYSPLTEHIQKKMPLPCDTHYFEIPSVHDYNHSVAKKDKPITGLLYNAQRFVLHIRGGSVDMIGSTLFYDSELKDWSFFHNADSDATEKFAVRIKGLMACKNFDL